VGHRVRRLSQQEENILIQKTTFNMQAVIIFAIETGMRLGEILSLQWSDIQNDMAVLNETKNNEIRYVPFTKKVIRLLQILPKNIEDNRVFFFGKQYLDLNQVGRSLKERKD
jgi:integrase